MSRTKLILLSLALLVLAAGFHNQIGRALPPEFFRFNPPVSPTKSSSPSHSGTVIWSADMETGDLSQWSVPDVPGGPNTGGGVFNSGLSTARVDSVGLAHSGLRAAKLFINTQSTEDLPTSGTRLFRWLEPEARVAIALPNLRDSCYHARKIVLHVKLCYHSRIRTRARNQP